MKQTDIADYLNRIRQFNDTHSTIFCDVVLARELKQKRDEDGRGN